MSANLFLRRGIAARVLRPGLLILLTLCFLTHPGSSFAQGPLSRAVDLLSPPAAAPDLVAACVQAPELREFGSTSWFPPPAQDDLAAAPLAASQSSNPDQVQRPTAKTHLTPALPRPPPFAPLS